MKLRAQLFGRRIVGTVYGFVFGAHQLGAGFIHDALGNRAWALLSGGIMCLVRGALAMRIDHTASREASFTMSSANQAVSGQDDTVALSPSQA